MLKITYRDLEAMLEHSRIEYPKEACGVIKGYLSVVDDVQIREVVKSYQVRNIRDNPLRGYRMHAKDMFRIFVELDPDLELLGFYHSHPRGPVGPSKTDIDECNYPGYTFLIISLTTYVAPDVSAWILDADRVEEEPLMLLS